MPKKPYIDILLPYKELFTPYNAGAVSTVVSDFAYHTTLEYEIYIYGRNLPSDTCLLYTSPSPRDGLLSRMPSSA